LILHFPSPREAILFLILKAHESPLTPPTPIYLFPHRHCHSCQNNSYRYRKKDIFPNGSIESHHSHSYRTGRNRYRHTFFGGLLELFAAGGVTFPSILRFTRYCHLFRFFRWALQIWVIPLFSETFSFTPFILRFRTCSYRHTNHQPKLLSQVGL
jgi:hypothetical protein